MHLNVRSILEVVCALGALSGLGFYILSACGMASFLREKRRAEPAKGRAQFPPVSILKPLKGIDPHIWEAFCTHCEQDYPEYELIFGVSDPDDPAIEVVRKLQQAYPGRRIELVVCTRDLGTNRKLSTLAQMLPLARHELLIVNDSDIRVPNDYLRRVLAPLRDEAVGMVTCLYRGIPANTVGSRLEALGISTDFVPGVLSARLIEHGLRFGLGSTLAFRRADLRAIGGFEAMLDYLADDYELGNRIAALGKRVELSEVIVDTFLPAYSVGEYFDHQLRWARSVRGSRTWGYVGLLLTFGVPWALALMILAPIKAIWAVALFLATVGLRMAVGLTAASNVLGDRQTERDVFLLPLRDLLAPVIWTIGLFGNRILWRGDVFYLRRGRLVRVATQPEHKEELPRLS